MSPHVPTIGCRDGWRNQAQLVYARDSVHDVKFAPRHLGLRLASASEDGLVRMYEAIDVMNLSHWPLQEEFIADKDVATCLSWNKSRLISYGTYWRLTIHQDDHLRAEVKEVARKHHHDSGVWRVEWNITGTMLAPSGSEGTVRMWKSDFEDEWVCVITICGDLGPVSPPPMDLCTS
ncbi:hypothetical protein PsorP6_014396 [Peronosclerospora sorghi]|uniref:Uncharacterized protein n=1 Tax=Peronosclerospora sorghi TaxID=230839 RepID=A0ACC0VGE7_9STRA|nr:hypothetical protein PsorP6_014396 [Peronosclerospora sorghi]